MYLTTTLPVSPTCALYKTLTVAGSAVDVGYAVPGQDHGGGGTLPAANAGEGAAQ